VTSTDVPAARTPVVLCIDVEPDERQVELVGAEWKGTRPTHALLERWRSRFELLTGAPVAFSWLWRTDPQIETAHGDPSWALREFGDLHDSTAVHGDAHGVHPHTWRLLDGTWVNDNLDRRWIDHCIDSSVAAFTDAVGAPPLIGRMGDRGLDPHAYRALRRNGLAIDLSVEPGAAPLDRDSAAPGTDFTAAPTWPYVPRRGDVARPSRWRRAPVLLPLSALIAPSPGAARPRLRTVYPWDPDAGELTTRLLDDGAAYLAFAVRSDIAIRPRLAEHFEGLLDALATHGGVRSLRFVTPHDALAALGRRR
jgi:hypothetical protein